jgi:hypothetical protein
MDERGRNDTPKLGPNDARSEATQDSTLLPMLIGGLVLIVIGMVFVMWLA